MSSGPSRTRGSSVSNQSSGSKGCSNPSGGKGPAGGSSGPSQPSKAPAAGSPSNIPRYLSFIIRIEQLHPNYDKQPRRESYNGYWEPPNRRDAYLTGNVTLWRWQGGIVTTVERNDVVYRAGTLQRYDVATLFSQYPDTPHLLVVPFDAKTRNVSEYGQGWRPISFDHRRRNSADGVREYYSSISAVGSESQIAAPGQGFWMPQLLHDWYNYRASPASQPRTHIGLIGNLPILLALAVFSAPAANLAEAMRSLQPGAWAPHGHHYPSGHTIGERGVVINILLDPANPEHSTRDRLNQLERGEFGPFYGRQPGTLPSAGPSRAIPTGPSTTPYAGRYSGPGAYRTP